MKTRDLLLDNLKALLIFLVVIGHLCDTSLGFIQDRSYEIAEASMAASGELDEAEAEIEDSVLLEIQGNAGRLCRSMFCAIYAFHMPLFVFLAGCTSKKIAGDRKRTISRCFSFFFLYIMMKFVNIAVQAAFGKTVSFSLLSESGVPWYALAMCFFYLIAYLTREFNQTLVLVLSLMIALLCGYDTSIGDYLVLSRVLVFYPFFLAGLLCNWDALKKTLRKPWVRWLSLLFLVVFLLFCWFQTDLIYTMRPLFTGRNSYKSLHEYQQYGFWLRLLCYLLSTAVSAAVIAVVPNRPFKVSVIGSRTLQIYFWHRSIIYVMSYAGVYQFLEALLGAGRARVSIVWMAFSFVLVWLLSFEPIQKPFQLLFRSSLRE